jgi:endonuclease/exonuclease/phosphatase family metal-dependent hydrolase
MVHGVRLGSGVWVVNVHSQNQPEALARKDTLAAAAAAHEWAGGAPLVFGGDVNLARPEVPGLRHLGGNHVDHIFSSGAPAQGRREVLDRGTLSDHPPVAVDVSV